MFETSYQIDARGTATETVKMKTFTGNDAGAVEHNVNDWLAMNNVSVSHIGQSQCERNGRLLFIISLFYSNAG